MIREWLFQLPNPDGTTRTGTIETASGDEWEVRGHLATTYRVPIENVKARPL